MGRLGPEPLEISAREFVRRIQAKRRLIKPLLLDQTFLAGVGNIYADESLHRARIHPRRNSAELSEEELRRLYRALKRILQAAIRAGGTSVRSYVDSDGVPRRIPEFSPRLPAGREGLPELRRDPRPGNGGRPKHLFLPPLPARIPS